MSLFKQSPRKLSKEELSELREISRCANMERFKATTFSKNTALLNSDQGMSGKTIAAGQEKIAQLMEGVLRDFMAKKLSELGYPLGTKVSIILDTGEIRLQKDA